jgi:hypothetical protein
MTEIYHYDAKNRPVSGYAAAIFTYDGPSPHAPLDRWYRVADSTGKERDSESGNDFAMARYDISRLGRFSSPDPSLATPAIPNPSIATPM